jgi:hypothetical protein
MIAGYIPIPQTGVLVRGDEHAARLDAEILARCHAFAPWGIAAAIDLGDCEPERIRDPGHIERFSLDLAALLEVRRRGAPIIVRIGAEPRLRGYSLVQIIEAALISGHFAEESDSAYIDIFCSKPYPPYRVAEFCRGWFGAATARISVTLRQTAPGR